MAVKDRPAAWPALALGLGLVLGACAGPSGAMAVRADGAEGRTCYRTLAEVDCHARPLQGEDSRRVGSFDWDAARMAAND